MKLTRREFVTWATVSGIALGVSRLATAAPRDFHTREALPGREGWNPAAQGAGRIDGVAKVTGAKLFVSDFRAADMPGWPGTTSHALLLRTDTATRSYEGLDLSGLSREARPSVVVTAADLDRTGVRVPEFYAGNLLCPVGETPLYLGQPAALLIFGTFEAYRRARLELRGRQVLKYGKTTGPVKPPNYGAYRFTRIAGAKPGAPDVYAPIDAGWISPSHIDPGGRPVWRPKKDDPAYLRGAVFGEDIRKGLDTAGPDSFVLESAFETQSIDPVFLEPECGLGWYNRDGGGLDLVLGVQSPYEAATAIAELLGEAKAPHKPARIHTQFAYVGGGFGGRDHTPFPLYVALAAVFFPGRPVRLAQDRYQQFQGGIKRHAFKIKSRIGIDRKTGRMFAFAADHALDGGGLANYSASVAAVGATAAIGIYDIPKVDVTTVAYHSRGVPAGSMRGYGTLQTNSALEVLVDEAAAALSIDPIDFRRRNMLRIGGRTMTGNPYTVSVRTPEILDKLEKHPIWRDRAGARSRARPGISVGTGIACCTKDFGSGADCSLGVVTMDETGRIAIEADATEMGNGIGTALANRVANQLGAVADEVTVARIDRYAPLGLVTSGNPYTMTQAEQDVAAKNPRWVPAISSATSSSIGAAVGTQAAMQAANVIYRFGLWPAALELWGIGPSDPRRITWREGFWDEGHLVVSGLPPLPLPALAAKAHARKGVTGAMAHAFSRWAWSSATFPLDDEQWQLDVDALAVRRGGGGFERIDRTAVAFPPTDYNRIGTAFTTCCGSLVRVEVDRTTGAVRVTEGYTVLECGHPLVPEVVRGQAQGAFAMAIGYTLLEHLPPYEDGPGNGKWNLGDYILARGSDMPLHNLEVEILPRLSPKEPPKGMAEVVMLPVVPAILNAIHDATGKRFATLPVTRDTIRRALR